MIGTVATLRREKNLPRLLRIFAALPQGRARLVIAGDGPCLSELQEQARALGIASRVAFPGYVSDPGSVLGGFDVFALTSDTEQMPFSILEAMACSRPIVATDVGDVRALLPNESRQFVVHPEDEDAFAKHLRRLIDDPMLRSRLGHMNEAHARQHFDRQEMIRSYQNLFSADSAAPRR